MQYSSRPQIKRNTRWWNSNWFDVAQLVAFSVGLIWLTVNGANQMGYNWTWYRIPKYFYKIIDGEFYRGPLIEGLFVTLEISAYGIIITLALGLITALLRMFNSLTGRLLASVYLEIVRYTPLLVQMFVFYFVLGPILDINRFWVGVFCISLLRDHLLLKSSAPAFSVWPGGSGKRATVWDSLKPIPIAMWVLPQAVPLMQPPFTGVIINLIKHSAIVSVIAVLISPHKPLISLPKPL